MLCFCLASLDFLVDAPQEFNTVLRWVFAGVRLLLRGKFWIPLCDTPKKNILPLLDDLEILDIFGVVVSTKQQLLRTLLTLPASYCSLGTCYEQLYYRHHALYKLR